jgi:excisionase family DNA binding protein
MSSARLQVHRDANGHRGREAEETVTTEPVVLHPVPATQKLLGDIGRTTLYQLIAQGELATVHIGRRMFIPSDAIADFIRRRRDNNGTAA